MRIPSLPSLFSLVKHIRLGLFLIMLAIAVTQILTALRGPAADAMGHFIIAAVCAGVAIRFYTAKGSSFNRAAAELERLAQRTTTK